MKFKFVIKQGKGTTTFAVTIELKLNL